MSFLVSHINVVVMPRICIQEELGLHLTVITSHAV